MQWETRQWFVVVNVLVQFQVAITGEDVGTFITLDILTTVSWINVSRERDLWEKGFVTNRTFGVTGRNWRGKITYGRQAENISNFVLLIVELLQQQIRRFDRAGERDRGGGSGDGCEGADGRGRLFQACLPLTADTTSLLASIGASSAAAVAFARVSGPVGPLVSVHVAVGRKSLSTTFTGERTLPRVDKHVSVQRAEGGQHLAAEAAVVNFGLASGIVGIGWGFDLIVTSNVRGELFLVGQGDVAEGALVVLRQRRAEVLAWVSRPLLSWYLFVWTAAHWSRWGPRRKGCWGWGSVEWKTSI